MASDVKADSNPPKNTTWSQVTETAPSQTRQDEPSFARILGLAGAMLAIFGGLVVAVTRFSTTPRFVPEWIGMVAFLLGVTGMFAHAARDADVQVRRGYGILGALWLLLAGIITLVPAGGGVGANFLPWGVLFLGLALLFLWPFGRLETEAPWRPVTLRTVAAVGAGLAVAGFVVSIILSPARDGATTDFLPKYGIVLLAFGLVYLATAVNLAGPAEPFGRRVAFAAGVLGLAMLLYGLGRAVLPWLAHSAGATATRPSPYFVPYGYLLTLAGLTYAGVSLLTWSDNRLIVLTRRELAALFYSPIAYIVLFGMTLVHALQFGLFFLGRLDRGLDEPIVSWLIIDLIPVLGVLFVVPALTMRLLSEEKRTGTLEMALTVPVDETPLVVSKFLAVWAYYLLLWVPLGVFLIGLRVVSGKAFDTFPLYGFGIALAASGAHFVAMGLFFSGLTRNQIVAAFLTFMGMTFLFAVSLIGFNSSLARALGLGADAQAVLSHLSFLNLWLDSLSGRLWLRDVILQLSLAAFWLFLTAKTLEARRWQ